MLKRFQHLGLKTLRIRIKNYEIQILEAKLLRIPPGTGSPLLFPLIFFFLMKVLPTENALFHFGILPPSTLPPPPPLPLSGIKEQCSTERKMNFYPENSHLEGLLSLASLHPKGENGHQKFFRENFNEENLSCETGRQNLAVLGRSWKLN